MKNVFNTREHCPVCQSDDNEILLKIPFNNSRVSDFLQSYYKDHFDLSLFDNAYFIIAGCQNCTLLYQKNILNDEYSYLLYEKWISPETSLLKKQHAPANLFQHYAKLATLVHQLINKDPYNIQVLEYGMGWGYCLRTMASFNYNVVGHELSKKRIEYARSMGLEVTDNLDYQGANFDFIYANQVFEHLPNPKEVMITLGRLLQPNGILHINVPQGFLMKQKLKQTSWKAKKDACHPLEHVNCFNRKSLIYLGKQASLDIVNSGYSLKSSILSNLPMDIARYIYDRTISTSVFFRKPE